MSELIRISKQGIDVLGTAGTVPNNLIFDSTLNTFKIVATGTQSVTVPSTSGTTVTIAHNQSGVPAAYGFFKYPDGVVSLPTEAQRGTVTGGNFGANNWVIEVDDTNIYFVFGSAIPSQYLGTLRYYIFEAPGS